MNVLGIVVHHTAVPSTVPMRHIRAFHVEKRGFRDIGYHWLIVETCVGWHAQVGRDESEDGAHCRGRNDCIGVAIGGNYEMDHLPTEAFDVLCDTLVAACVRHELAPDTISYHAQHCDTSCPGQHVIEIWGHIIDEVRERMPL